MPKSIRLRVALIAWVVYLIAGGFCLWLRPEYLGALSGYLAATSLPVLMQIAGESYRESKKEKHA